MHAENEVLPLKRVSNSFQLMDSNNRFVPFENLKRGSIVVINDLELYWRKTTGGLIQVKQLLKLIKSYPQVLFIVECNILLLSHLNECTDLSEKVISYIQTSSFSSDNIEKALDEKNKISGKSITLKGD